MPIKWVIRQKSKWGGSIWLQSLCSSTMCQNSSEKEVFPKSPFFLPIHSTHERTEFEHYFLKILCNSNQEQEMKVFNYVQRSRKVKKEHEKGPWNFPVLRTSLWECYKAPFLSLALSSPLLLQRSMLLFSSINLIKLYTFTHLLLAKRE